MDSRLFLAPDLLRKDNAPGLAVGLLAADKLAGSRGAAEIWSIASERDRDSQLPADLSCESYNAFVVGMVWPRAVRNDDIRTGTPYRIATQARCLKIFERCGTILAVAHIERDGTDPQIFT